MRREDYNKVGQDDEGHLVVEHRARGGPLDNTLEEDGHYSSREENFKKVCMLVRAFVLHEGMSAPAPDHAYQALWPFVSCGSVDAIDLREMRTHCAHFAL